MELADLEEAVDAVAQAIARGPVVPEHAGRARVGQQVGVTLMQVPVWKGPVVQRRACRSPCHHVSAHFSPN